MKTTLLLGLIAGLSPLLAEASTIGFQGALPPESKWINAGDIPVQSVDIGGVKALAFVDTSDTQVPSIQFPIDGALAARMRSEGYTLNARFKDLIDEGTGGNFSFAIRLPGMFPLLIGPYGNKEKRTIGVGCFDSPSQSNKSVSIPYTDAFVNLRVVVRPDPATGMLLGDISLDGGEPVKIALAPMDRSSPALIEIGGRGGAPITRTGSTYVESFSVSVP